MTASNEQAMVDELADQARTAVVEAGARACIEVDRATRAYHERLEAGDWVDFWDLVPPAVREAVRKP